MNLEFDVSKMGLRIDAYLTDDWWTTIEIYSHPDHLDDKLFLFDARIERWDQDPLVFTNLKTHTWPLKETLAENVEEYLRNPQIVRRWKGKNTVTSTGTLSWFFDVEVTPNGQEQFKTVCRVYSKTVAQIHIKFKGYSQTTYVESDDQKRLLDAIAEEVRKRCSSWVHEAIKTAGYETDENDPYILSVLSSKSIRQEG